MGRGKAIGMALLTIAVVTSTAVAVAGGRLPADPAVSEWPNWPYRATCGSMSFSPDDVFQEAPEAGRGSTRLDRALRRSLRLYGRITPHRRGWRFLGAAHGFAGFSHGHPGAEAETPGQLEY